MELHERIQTARPITGPDGRDPFSVTLPLGYELWGEADVVLGVGTRLFYGFHQWGIDDKLAIIRVDADPEEPERCRRPAVALIGDAKPILRRLIDALGAHNSARPSRREEMIERQGKMRARLAKLAPLVEVGLNHEQQHQELMLTDILHAFAQNPIPPAYDPSWRFPASHRSAEEWVTLNEGIHTVGHADDSFHFDNEKPAHRALVGPVRLARNLVTNAEWLAFMKDGGYGTATLWLMDGFAVATNEGWQAPGHWRQVDGEWRIMTLGGLQPVDPSAPVSHVSYYEADAFARWAGRHLPTEMEWEVAARAGQLNDAFGIVWQWTRSAYSPYPGYRAIEGALGEYNGKFMVNQLVLRGSSLATPAGHSRITYRNFFYPFHRWQFTGLRLADYA